MKRLIPDAVERQIGRVLQIMSPVIWANLGSISRFLAHSIPTLSPPLLVISIPRSGSSWVGDILGLSATSLYLREPITQTYLARKGPCASFFEVNPNKLPLTYKSSADAAFEGLPKFPGSIVRYPFQWVLSGRSRRRLVIKEVNPFALDWLLNGYKPKVIYLIRHPAAVANSFFSRGWTGKQFENRFLPQTLNSESFHYNQFLHSFWAEHGALQAVLLKRCLDSLKGYQDYRIVKYEDLCEKPKDIFYELFEFGELEWSGEIAAEIDRRTKASTPYAIGKYDLERNSRDMIKKWKTEMSKDSIAQIKEAFLFYSPPYYGSDEW